MRRAARKDENHNEIKIAFETLGWSAKDIHQIPDFADLLIGKPWVNVVIEIKDGNKPPSARKLTKGEQDFKDSWNGPYRIVTSIGDVLNVDAEFNAKNISTE